MLLRGRLRGVLLLRALGRRLNVIVLLLNGCLLVTNSLLLLLLLVRSLLQSTIRCTLVVELLLTCMGVLVELSTGHGCGNCRCRHGCATTRGSLPVLLRGHHLALNRGRVRDGAHRKRKLDPHWAVRDVVLNSVSNDCTSCVAQLRSSARVEQGSFEIAFVG